MSEPYDLSDEALEEAFRAAKAELEASANAVDDDNVDTTVDDDSADNDNDVDNDDDTGAADSDNTDDTSDADSDASIDDEVDDDTDNTSTTDDEDDEADKTTAEKSTPSIHKFRANGKEYEITDEEMKEQFPRIFGQAMDYTKKMQSIKPWRKTIDAIEQAKLKHDDINLMIDVLKGDKTAIAEVLKRTGVDPIDINQEDSTYKRNDYGRDGAVLDLQDVIDSIKNDAEYVVTHNVISKEWDDTSWEVLSSDPEKIKLLHVDVKSGLYDKLQPIAQKIKVFDNARRSDLDYYFEAAREYYKKVNTEQPQERDAALRKREQALNVKTRVAQVETDTRKRTEAKEVAAKRKAAATTGRSTSKNGPVDYLSATDEDFDEWYKKLEER